MGGGGLCVCVYALSNNALAALGCFCVLLRMCVDEFVRLFGATVPKKQILV